MKAKRFLSILLAVMLAFSCVALTASVSAAAADSSVTYGGATATDYDYSLKIVMYADTSASTSSESNTYGSEQSQLSLVEGVVYNIYYSSTYTSDYSSISSLTTVGEVQTDSSGVAMLYTNTAGWYIAIPSTIQPSYVTTAAAAFTVYLPVSSTETGATVYPKSVVTGGLQFTKTWQGSTTTSSDKATFSLQVYTGSGTASASDAYNSTDWTTVKVSESSGVYSVDETNGSDTFTITGDGNTTNTVYINDLTYGSTYRIVENSVTSSDYPNTTAVSSTTYTVNAAGYYTTSWTGSYGSLGITNTSSTTPSVEKTVKGNVDAATAYTTSTDIDSESDSGTANWKIKANFTGDIQSYQEYIVTDTLSSYLVAPEASAITVKYYNSNDEEYTLVGGNGSNATDTASVSVSGQKITVNFANVIKYLPANGYALITFNTTFSSSYTYDTKVYNGAMITYKNQTDTISQYIDNDGDQGDADNQGDADDEGNPTDISETDGGDNSDPSIWSGKLTVTKKNSATGETITSGTATFAVYKESGTTSGYSDDDTEITTSLVTSNGVATLSGLDAGTYYIVETEAPSDYTKTSTVTTVVISDVTSSSTDSSYNSSTGAMSVSVEIENTPNTNLPLTGGSGLYLIVGLGLALVAVGGYMFFRRKRTA